MGRLKSWSPTSQIADQPRHFSCNTFLSNLRTISYLFIMPLSLYAKILPYREIRALSWEYHHPLVSCSTNSSSSTCPFFFLPASKKQTTQERKEKIMLEIETKKEIEVARWMIDKWREEKKREKKRKGKREKRNGHTLFKGQTIYLMLWSFFLLILTSILPI